MALIRLQNKVPAVYVDESRDFQIICRVYDILINGIKYDIDGISRLIDTNSSKSTTLQLLQTKLGFFTSKNFTDEVLRYILKCFPILVKKKGTLKAIEEAIYMFLKINSLETMIKITIINDTPTEQEKQTYGTYITDHSIIIGIESSIRDTTPLYEVLKYIIPFGYNLFFYFFQGQEETNIITYTQNVDYIYVGNDINSAATGSQRPHTLYTDEIEEIKERLPRNVKFNPATYAISFPEYENGWTDIWNDSDIFSDTITQVVDETTNKLDYYPVVVNTLVFKDTDGNVVEGGSVDKDGVVTVPTGAISAEYKYMVGLRGFNNEVAQRQIGAFNTIEIVESEIKSQKPKIKVTADSIYSVQDLDEE